MIKYLVAVFWIMNSVTCAVFLAYKSDSHLPINCFIYFNESLLKMMKNAFYVNLKAIFILKIFKLLCSSFVQVEKTTWLER